MGSSLSRFCSWVAAAVLLFPAAKMHAQYAGFDRNVYPGDNAMAALRSSFIYTAFWLNPPPGGNTNGWQGKRQLVRTLGYGFLLLWNGRLDAALQDSPAQLGTADGIAAAQAAAREGFPPGAVIFLDQEEGGRLTREQAAYIAGWIDALGKTRYKAGVYASGIEVPDGGSQTISTARDVRGRFPGLPLWVANDQCPPAPGCRANKLPPGQSGIRDAAVWQYAQSPGRPDFTARCRQTYAADGNCYPPGGGAELFVDLNTASSSDPSHGR